jgi:hypothetical protein
VIAACRRRGPGTRRGAGRGRIGIRRRRTRITYTGRGYDHGYREGEKADIGGPKIRPRPAGALGR